MFSFAFPFFDAVSLITIEVLIVSLTGSANNTSATFGITETLLTIAESGLLSLFLLPNYIQAASAMTYAYYLFDSS